MANDVVIRFISQDNASATADKVATSINKVGTAGASATQSTKSLIGSLGGMAGTVTGVTAVASAIVGVGVIAFDTAASFAYLYDQTENYRRSFEMLLEDKAAGDALFESVRVFSERTPFESNDVVLMAQRLLAAGVAAQDIIPYIEGVGNASFAMGGNAESASRVVLALSQSLNSGRVKMEEINQVMDAGVPILSMMANWYGITTDELVKYISDGVVPAAKFTDDFIQAANGKFGDAMANQLGTATQASSNFNDSLSRVSERLGEITSQKVRDGFTLLTIAVDTTSKAVEVGISYWTRLQNAIFSTMRSGVPVTREYTDSLDAGNTMLERWDENGRRINDIVIDTSDAMLQAGATINMATGAISNNIVVQDRIGDSLMRTDTHTIELVASTNRLASGMSAAARAEQEAARAAAELADNQAKLQLATSSLETSFLDIADAQRKVVDTQKALDRATSADTINSYRIAVEKSQISIRQNSAEMASMRQRQQEINATLRAGIDLQQKVIELNEYEKQTLSHINEEMPLLIARRGDIEKQLKASDLSASRRVDLMQEQYDIQANIDAYGKTAGDLLAKSTQQALTTEQRNQLLAEQRSLSMDITNKMLDQRSAVIALSSAQQDLNDALDPAKVEALKDANTRAKMAYDALLVTQQNTIASIKDLSDKTGTAVNITDLMASAAARSATPLDDMAVAAGHLSKSISGKDGAGFALGNMGAGISLIAGSSVKAIDGVKGFSSAVASIDTKSMDVVNPKLQAFASAVSLIADANEAMAIDNISTLITNVGNALGGRSSGQTFGRSTQYLAPSPMLTAASMLGTQYDNSAGTPATGSQQIVQIYLNSGDATQQLVEVESYLKAQGGLLRI